MRKLAITFALLVLFTISVNAQTNSVLQSAATKSLVFQTLDRAEFTVLKGNKAKLTVDEARLVNHLDNEQLVPGMDSKKVIVISVTSVGSYPDTSKLKDGDRVEFAADTVVRAVGYLQGGRIGVFEYKHGVWGIPGTR